MLGYTCLENRLQEKPVFSDVSSLYVLSNELGTVESRFANHSCSRCAPLMLLSAVYEIITMLLRPTKLIQWSPTNGEVGLFLPLGRGCYDICNLRLELN